MPISVSSRKKTVPVYALVHGRGSRGGGLTVGRAFGDVVAYTDGDGILRLEISEEQLRTLLREFDESRDDAARRYAWVDRAQADAQNPVERVEVPKL